MSVEPQKPFLQAVVLAAGKGTRMNSDLAKVLHQVSGVSLLDRVLNVVEAARVDHTVVVVGHQADRVRQLCGRPGLDFVVQDPQLGTGHAVQVAVPSLVEKGWCVVLAGDVPLLRPATLSKLVEAAWQRQAAAAVLTCIVPDAAAYGRIIKDDQGRVQAIVEAKDATEEQLRVGEYNTGVFCFRTDLMIEALGSLKNDNKQGEYYLTDTVAYLVGAGQLVTAVTTGDPDEVVGINTVAELAAAEEILERRGS